LESYNIAGNGEALACCGLPPGMQGDLALGNITNCSPEQLDKIYYGQKAKELWRKNLNCEIYKLSACKECLGWSWYPNIWRRNPFYPIFGAKWF
jgi:hypothetical protein